MTTLSELRDAMNQFLTSAIESTYHTSKPDLEQIKNELIKVIDQYIKEQEDDIKSKI
jgi:septum formation topological specificity factor MinE